MLAQKLEYCFLFWCSTRLGFVQIPLSFQTNSLLFLLARCSTNHLLFSDFHSGHITHAWRPISSFSLGAQQNQILFNYLYLDKSRDLETASFLFLYSSNEPTFVHLPLFGIRILSDLVRCSTSFY